jgi:hypothetical protein
MGVVTMMMISMTDFPMVPHRMTAALPQEYAKMYLNLTTAHPTVRVTAKITAHPTMRVAATMAHQRVATPLTSRQKSVSRLLSSAKMLTTTLTATTSSQPESQE